ncbi:hypothetical protein [Gordonia sp. OPL2]|uniref:hypothetical protein n=1 Tax=Gordonia sp. OPL2 TaxID=2486274 RepID=UPI001654D2B6|nr:hypothetical protein [Gordonia sp. OPL2]ROZ88096.1 hypothetical protein EEB19_22435 [Gordonia sp. OPL2]
MITTTATQIVLADGLIDTFNGLTGDVIKALLTVGGGFAVYMVLKEFVRGGLVAGIVAVVGGGAILWGLNNMDFLSEQTGETVKNSSSQLAPATVAPDGAAMTVRLDDAGRGEHPVILLARQVQR